MAGFENAGLPGALSKIQELIAQYIGTIEAERLAECQVVFAQAAKAKQDLDDLLTQIVQNNNVLNEIGYRRDSLEAEIVGLAKSKEEKQQQLDDVVSQQSMADAALLLAQSALDTVVASASDKAAERDSVQGQVVSLTKDLIDVKSRLAAKQAEFDALDSKRIAAEQVVQDAAQKLADIVSTITSAQNNLAVVTQSIADATDVRDQVVVKLNAAQQELSAFLSDMQDQKNKVAAALSDAQAELKSVQDERDAQKSQIESEKLFIQQANDVISQKSKSLAYAKDKLQEIVTQLSLEVDADPQKQSSLKALLLVVDQL